MEQPFSSRLSSSVPKFTFPVAQMISNDPKEREALCLATLRSLLTTYKITLTINSVLDCTPSLFIVCFEKLCGYVPDLTRKAGSRESRLRNIRIILGILAHDVLQADMSHISPEGLCNGDKESIMALIELFAALQKIPEDQRKKNRKNDSKGLKTHNNKENIGLANRNISVSSVSTPSADDIISVNSSSIHKMDLRHQIQANNSQPLIENKQRLKMKFDFGSFSKSSDTPRDRLSGTGNRAASENSSKPHVIQTNYDKINQNIQTGHRNVGVETIHSNLRSSSKSINNQKRTIQQSSSSLSSNFRNSSEDKRDVPHQRHTQSQRYKNLQQQSEAESTSTSQHSRKRMADPFKLSTEASKRIKTRSSHDSFERSGTPQNLRINPTDTPFTRALKDRRARLIRESDMLASEGKQRSLYLSRKISETSRRLVNIKYGISLEKRKDNSSKREKYDQSTFASRKRAGIPSISSDAEYTDNHLSERNYYGSEFSASSNNRYEEDTQPDTEGALPLLARYIEHEMPGTKFSEGFNNRIWKHELERSKKSIENERWQKGKENKIHREHEARAIKVLEKSFERDQRLAKEKENAVALRAHQYACKEQQRQTAKLRKKQEEIEIDVKNLAKQRNYREEKLLTDLYKDCYKKQLPQTRDHCTLNEISRNKENQGKEGRESFLKEQILMLEAQVRELKSNQHVADKAQTQVLRQLESEQKRELYNKIDNLRERLKGEYEKNFVCLEDEARRIKEGFRK
ncbi:10294_t:CDS:2 [Ambispora gerdemannii]|uniref:10294_t:CDS:1 n=1 Tax=Ambispora gerdemannii TaxID=144530 RepID=A0A9N8ZK27_9GLOM|nr:10294_t:CDS:2 [Ambispora gerdemannii]